MSWTTPKTDWTNTDFFNIEDYNRIVGNLLYVKDLVTPMFGNEVTFESMQTSKSYSSMIYAREVNAICNNLEALNNASYHGEIGEKTVYQANGRTPLYTDLNRIESAILNLKERLINDTNIIPRMSFVMGRSKERY